MSDDKQTPIGKIGWADVTVPNADVVLQFYKEVIGWESEGVGMQEADDSYEDYIVKDVAGDAVGGVCYQRGVNADLPPVWLIYVPVEDVEASITRCLELGGAVVKRVEDNGKVVFVVIKDPAGAMMALTPAE